MDYQNSQQSPASVEAPSAVSLANNSFLKSPLILFAVICYVVYTVVATYNTLPCLGNIDLIFKIISISFFMFLSTFCALFLFIGPVLIAVGLCKMYFSGGKKGASLLCAGIRVFMVLSCIMVASMLLFFIFERDALKQFSAFIDEAGLPLVFFIFGVVASLSMCEFAYAVQYTSVTGKPSTDGVAKAGILMVIYSAASLFCLFELIENLNVFQTSAHSILGNTDTSTIELANLFHIAAYVLFSIAALNYVNVISRAEEADLYQEKLAKEAQEQAKEAEKQAQEAARQAREAEKQAQEAASQASAPPVQTAPVTPPVAQPSSVQEYLFCTNCGKQCAATAKFCRYCGHKQEE